MNKPVPVPPPLPTTLDDVMRRLDRIDDNLDICVSQGQSNGQAIGRLEDRVDGLETRQRSNSDRVRHESSANMQQDAAIAELHTKLDKLTGIAERLDKVAANPKVRMVGRALFTAAAAYLAMKGIKVLP